MCYKVPNQTHMMPSLREKIKVCLELVELKELSRKLSGSRDNFTGLYLVEKCRLTPFDV